METSALPIAQAVVQELIRSVIDGCKTGDLDKFHAQHFSELFSGANRLQVLAEKLRFRVDVVNTETFAGHHYHEKRPAKYKGFFGQIQTIKQQNNSACGYFALYNALWALRAIRATREADALDCMAKLQDRVNFWRTYMRMIGDLKRKALLQSSNSYPWSVRHIEQGVMERPYMEYLLQHEPLVKLLSDEHGESMITAFPEFSWDQLKHNALSVRYLTTLDRIFERFRTRKNYAHTFILGQTNHWVTIVINKYEDTHVEVVLLDSRNYDILNLSDSQIEAFAIRRSEELRLPHWRIHLFYRSMVSSKHIAAMFYDCAVGSMHSIGRFLIRLNMCGFFETFEKSFLPEENGSANGPLSWHIALRHWLENYFPPPVLHENVCKFIESLGGVEALDGDIRMRFREWVEAVKANIEWPIELSGEQEDGEEADATESDMMVRFAKIFRWFQAHFGMHSNGPHGVSHL